MLLAGQQTCDSQVEGLSPSLGQATYTRMCPYVTKQYNLVLPSGVISLTGNVTVGLVENNGNLPLGL